MTIISCIKQVQDLDMVLTDDWFIQEDGKSIDISYANKIMNTYDETALELMLRLVDEAQKINTHVITVGDKSKESILRKALAVGVQKAIRIDVVEKAEYTPSAIAKMLASVIEDTKDAELVLCGRQADNYSHGLTGQLLAKELGWPCFTLVTEIEYKQGIYHLSRIVEEGIEHISVKGPIVVTVSQSGNKFLRMATLKKTMEAKKQEIKVIIPKESLHISKKLMKSNKNLLNIVELKVNKTNKHCIYWQSREDMSLQDQLQELLLEYSKNRGAIG